MIHANQNYLLESEVIGHLQRRIGHCPAFMHSHAYVVTEAAGRTGRVDLISKSVFRNEAIGPITDELDAVERRDAGHRLLPHLPVHRDAAAWLDVEFLTAANYLIHPANGLSPAERKIHS